MPLFEIRPFVATPRSGGSDSDIGQVWVNCFASPDNDLVRYSEISLPKFELFIKSGYPNMKCSGL